METILVFNSKQKTLSLFPSLIYITIKYFFCQLLTFTIFLISLKEGSVMKSFLNNLSDGILKDKLTDLMKNLKEDNLIDPKNSDLILSYICQTYASLEKEINNKSIYLDKFFSIKDVYYINDLIRDIRSKLKGLKDYQRRRKEYFQGVEINDKMKWILDNFKYDGSRSSNDDINLKFTNNTKKCFITLQETGRSFDVLIKDNPIKTLVEIKLNDHYKDFEKPMVDFLFDELKEINN
jgi:hypothetical protein